MSAWNQAFFSALDAASDARIKLLEYVAALHDADPRDDVVKTLLQAYEELPDACEHVNALSRVYVGSGSRPEQVVSSV